MCIYAAEKIKSLLTLTVSHTRAAVSRMGLNEGRMSTSKAKSHMSLPSQSGEHIPVGVFNLSTDLKTQTTLQEIVFYIYKKQR